MPLYRAYMIDANGHFEEAKHCTLRSGRWYWPQGDPFHTDYSAIVILSEQEVYLLYTIYDPTWRYRVAIKTDSKNRKYREVHSDYHDLKKVIDVEYEELVSKIVSIYV